MEATRFCKRIGAQAEYWKVPDYVEVCERCEFYYCKPEADAEIARLTGLLSKIADALNTPWPFPCEKTEHDDLLVESAVDAGKTLQAIGKKHGGDWSQWAEIEQAVDTKIARLEADNASMIAAAANALGTDPEYRSAGCVDALVCHYESVKAENTALRKRLVRLVEAAKKVLHVTACLGFYPDCDCIRCKLKQAIAAAESE